MIGPLTFLSLNGLQIRTYTSTTFMHTKFMAADGRKLWIGSINFSWTSFMKNREAGVYFTERSTNGQLYSFAEAVFNGDFSTGLPFVPTQTYSSSDMAVITDTSAVPVVMPTPVVFNTSVYVSQWEPVTGEATVTLYASPDYARDTLIDVLQNTQSTLSIEIYQITDPDLCSLILNMSSTVQIQLLVSNKIYSYDDWKLADTCYKSLYNNGLSFKKTEASTYTYTHAKFWIQDGTTVGLSSGNMSPSDVPSGDSFPPYGSSGWTNVNRDLNMIVSQAGVVAQFQKVLSEDWQRGESWYPSAPVLYDPSPARFH
jgi:phosphatidylserine/phosphatidylglycerophosphate/cardiolipin synthase-like enzyme